MNKTVALKIFVDAIMLVLYVQLMFFYGANPLYHEIAGIAVGVVCIVHVALNAKSTQNLARRCSSAKKSGKPRLQLTLDAILLVLMAATVISGVLIAKELFFGPGGLTLSFVHTTVSYACLAVIAAHLLQHVKYLAGVMKPKKLRKPSATPARLPRAATMQSRREFLKGSLALGVGLFTVASSALLDAPQLAQAALGTSDTVTRENTEFEVNDTPVQESSKPVQSRSREASASEVPVTSEEYATSETSETPESTAAPSEASAETSATAVDTASIICPVCRKACPLSNLQCQKGVNWASANGYL